MNPLLIIGLVWIAVGLLLLIVAHFANVGQKRAERRRREARDAWLHRR